RQNARTQLYTLSLHDALPISTSSKLYQTHHPHPVERCAADQDGASREYQTIPRTKVLPSSVLRLFQNWGFGSLWVTVLSGILTRSEEHTSELQSRRDLVCRLL